MAKFVKMDLVRHQAYVNDTAVDMPPKEFEVLKQFCLARPGEVINRDQLQKSVYGGRKLATRTIDQHIARLRKKIGKKIIKTVTKYGYRLEVPGMVAA